MPFSIVLILIVWAICAYNRLVTLRNDVKNAWHQIDVQLKRRHDLIPNLVAAVRGYMDFEKDVLQKVVEARSRALSAVDLKARALAEDGLTRAVHDLFLSFEQYPMLRSSEHVLLLQEELTSTENRIAFSRQHYNDSAANYMTRLDMFPDSLIASAFGFAGAEYFSSVRETGDAKP